ncbi:MAG TPA: RlmE family RNA methyltransferase [Gammaproteobacteria bacterium]|nr:RlmE family RNA methyltransferase [Gammaproteobacteria bacterium]
MSARRGKTKRWAQTQSRDPWVRKARARGLPARSAFKLEEVIERHRLLRPGQAVLELGAAPGGWTRIAVQAVGASGRVVGIDRLEMKPVPGARILRADLTEPGVLERLREALDGPADVVLCDIAPNITGIRDVDAANQEELAELSSDCAAALLKPGGDFFIKAFEGEGSRDLRRRLEREYASVKRLKPAASRDRSSEFYLLAQGLTNPDTAGGRH